MRAWLVFLLLPLAGCLGGTDDDTSQARMAYDLSQSAVDRKYEYSLFLGVTGTEGTLDWAAYEEDLRAQGGQGARLANAFDQDVPNGRFGDGRLGAWVTTHFAYDEDERLLGGLFTQVTSDGERRGLFAPFTGPYSGTTAFVSAQRLAMHQALGADTLIALQEAQENPVLCALRTAVDAWDVSSADAARIALDTQAMQDHMARYPEGELTYYYFPRLTVEDGCPATLDVPSNHWIVFHTDLDTYLDPDQDMPSVAKVTIDAQSGDVRAIVTEPLALRAPHLLDTLIEAKDPLLPDGWQVESVDIPVETGADILEIQSFRRLRPAHEVDAETLLRAPDGRPIARQSFDTPLHHYAIEDPQPGTWVFEYRHHSLTPGGEHAVELHGAVVYS